MSRSFVVFVILFCVVVQSSAQEVRDVYVAPCALFPFDPLTDRYEPRSLASVATYVRAWRDEGSDIRLHVSTVNFSRGTLLYLSLADSVLFNRVLSSLDARILADTVGVKLAVSIYDFPQSKEFLSDFTKDIERIKNFYSIPLCRLDSVLRYDPYAPSEYSDLLHNFQLVTSKADVSLFAPTRLDSRIDSLVYIRTIERQFPYDNQLVAINMSGRELKKLLENIYGSRFYGLRNEQSDLLNVNLPPSMHTSVAGVSFSVNLTRPKGRRVENCGLDDDKIYRVAMNSFAASKTGKLAINSGDYKTLLIKYLRSSPKLSRCEWWSLKPERWVEKIKQRENLQIHNL